ncbi:MAG: hypothetical protein ABW221_06755 [Vicinamibacteria bacterium]
MKATLVAVLFVSAGATAQAGMWDCGQTAPREGRADAAGARSVRVIAKAGELKIRGVAGASEVTVKGTACASRESGLSEVKLVTERRGDVVYVEAVTPEWTWGSAALDLEIDLPNSIPLDVDDGSGSAEVRDVASLKIVDGSGELVIDGIRGALTVDDGSGSLQIANVGGEVKITDGSGEIVVRQAGSVLITEDGSGSIQINDVRGNVVVRNDGSGSIDVREVAGDFTVDDDGSGGIEHHGVRGHVKVPSDN